MYSVDNDGWTPAMEPGAVREANAAGVPGGSVVAFRERDGTWKATGLGLLIAGGYLAANENVRRFDREPFADPPWCYCPVTKGSSQEWVRAFTVDRDEAFWRTRKPAASDGDGLGELPWNPDVMVCSYTLRFNTENAWGSSRLEGPGRALVSDLVFFGEKGAVGNHAGYYDVLFNDGSQRTFRDENDVVADVCRGVNAEEIEETVDRAIFGELFDPLFQDD